MKTLSSVLIASAALLIGAGCVDSDPTMLATAHVFGECDTSGALETTTLDGEIIFAGQVSIDLATINDGGAGQTVAFVEREIQGATPDQTETVIDPVGQTGIFGINYVARNQLFPTTEYTSVGYDSELRIDQNQFLLEAIEFNVTDSPAPYELNDVAYTGLSGTGGDLWVGNAAILGPQQVVQWSDITTAVAGNNSIVPVTVESKLVGSLVDGTSAESNVVRLELLVCNGCGIPTTALCQLTE